MAIEKVKRRRKKKPRGDGLGPRDIKYIRSALRKVWHDYGWARKLVLNEAARPGFMFECCKCQTLTREIKIDHIVAVGKVDGGFIERLFCPSSGLQALCKICHDEKTNEERKWAGW